MINKREKNLTRLLYAIAVLIPCIFLVLWYLIQGHGFLGAKPYFSDELGYWRVMYSFSQCGFGFGKGESFVGYDAPIGNLGCHGIAPLLAWAWYALIFPWKENSLFIANFIALTASIGIFVLLVKPDRKQMLFIIPALLLYAPIALYINTCMMEVFCSASVIVYTALYLRWREKKEKAVFVLALICGVYITGLRIFYAMLLLPLLWEKVGWGLNRKTLLLFVCFAAGTISFYKITSSFVAPYPWWFTVLIKNLPVRYKLSAVLSHFIINVRSYLKLCFLVIDTEAAFRWLYLAVMVLFGIDAVKNRKNRWRSVSFLMIYAAILFANLLLYDVGGWLDLRMMSPALLFALLCIMTDTEMIKGAKTVVSVLAAVFFLIAFRAVISGGAFVYESRFEETPDNREAFGEVFGENIASVSAMSEDGVFDRIKDIPPQIGVKWMNDDGGVIDSDTEFIMTGGDDREVSPDYEFIGMPAEKCYVYKRID